MQVLAKLDSTGLYLLIGGLIIILIAINRYNKFSQYKKEGIKTKAKIIDLEEVWTIRQRVAMWHPLVRFTLQNGDWFTGRYTDGQSPAAFQKGQDVEVLYLEDEPGQFIIVKPRKIYLEVVILLVGVLVILMGLFKLFMQ